MKPQQKPRVIQYLPRYCIDCNCSDVRSGHCCLLFVLVLSRLGFCQVLTPARWQSVVKVYDLVACQPACRRRSLLTRVKLDLLIWMSLFRSEQLPVCRVIHAASRNLLHVLLLMLLLQSMLLFKFCYYLVWLSFGNLVFYI